MDSKWNKRIIINSRFTQILRSKNLIICIELLFNNIEPKQILFLMNQNAKSLTLRSRICRIISLLNIYGALMFSMPNLPP